MDQGLIFHPKILTLGEKREEERKRRRTPGRGGRSSVLAPGEREKPGERKGEGVRGYLTPTTLNPKD